jgi:tRNA pseudouridine38-40 synthase
MATYTHRLIISYKGTNYYGWQDLGEHEQKPSIESNIHQVLKQICNYQDCTIATASRTDAGVHAQGQVVKINIPLDIKSDKLLLGMNSLLPDAIRILKCAPCDAEFNPNKDAKSKEYHYLFCTDLVHNPVLNDTMAHIPTSLNIEHMKEACKLFVGIHDFYSFAKRDTSKNSTIRSILSCELVQSTTTFGNNTYVIKIVGEGFLRYMIRYIAAALFEVGRGEITLSDISEALKSPKDEKISPKAKPHGLHLIKINY